MPVLVLAFCYFIALFFVTTNLTFLIVTLLFLLVLYILLRDFVQAMLLVYVACLPFARGKTLDIILIPVEQIPQFGLYDVGYYFPLYPSMVFLVGLLYLIFRKKVNVWKYKGSRIVLIGLIAFVGVTTIPMFTSLFPVVVGLSVVQVVLAVCVYFLPYCLQLSSSVIRRMSHVIAAFVVFEFGWIVAQIVQRGPLNRYIEAILPLNRSGILSTEDPSLMRFNGTFYEPSIMGTFMLMHFYYFLILVIREKRLSRIERSVYIITMIGALLCIIFSGSRGIYGLTLLFGYFIFPRNKMILKLRKPIWPHLRIVIISCLIGALVLSPYVMKRLQTTSTLFSQYGSGSFRLQLNTMALRLSQNHLFGVGLNLSPYYFAYDFPSERWVDPSHPHNFIFQMLAETGFPGVVAFFIFLWLAYRRYIVRHKLCAEPHFYASIIFLLGAQFYPIFIAHPEVLSFFFLHAGLMNWTSKYA